MILQFIKIFATRTIFMYLVCALIVWRILDYPVFKKNAVEQSMNRLPPLVNYFKDFVQNKGPYDSFLLSRCIVYHQKVVDFFPFERAEAYSILGYLYDLSGDSQKAIKAYKACLDLNPNYFWPWYNLGIGAFKKGNYSKAVEYFQTALERNVNINMLLLIRAKVYSDIRLTDANFTNYDFEQAIDEGRENSYIFLMESLFKLGQYPKIFNVAMLGLKEEHVSHPDIFYFYAGKAAYHQKMYGEAFSVLELALKNNPVNSDAIYYAALTLDNMGRKSEAAEYYKKAQDLQALGGSIIDQHLKAGVRFY